MKQAGGLRCGGLACEDQRCRDTGLPGHFHIRVDAIAHHQHLFRSEMEAIASSSRIDGFGFPKTIGCRPVAAVRQAQREPQSTRTVGSSVGQTKSGCVARKGNPVLIQ